jgi:hypothetical protein
MKLRILCVFYDKDPRFLATDPLLVLGEHDVTIRQTFKDAVRAIETSTQIPPFHVILSDAALAHTDAKNGLHIFSPMFFLRYIQEKLVRGLGVFVPEFYSIDFTSAFDDNVVVASKDCWTLDGLRDWEGLLTEVIEAVRLEDENV